MYVVVRGLRPPSRRIEKDGVDLLSLSLSHESEKVLSYCVFGDYLVLLIIVGIVEVWGFLLFAKAFCRYSRKWRCLRLINVERPST